MSKKGKSRHGNWLFISDLGSRVRARPRDHRFSGRWCRHRETDDTRGHKGTPQTIQQTNHCTPFSSALGQRLQARHAVALQCGVRLLVSTSRTRLRHVPRLRFHGRGGVFGFRRCQWCKFGFRRCQWCEPVRRRLGARQQSKGYWCRVC